MQDETKLNEGEEMSDYIIEDEPSPEIKFDQNKSIFKDIIVESETRKKDCFEQDWSNQNFKPTIEVSTEEAFINCLRTYY